MEVDMMKATPGVQKDDTMLESFISHSAIGLLRHFTKRYLSTLVDRRRHVRALRVCERKVDGEDLQLQVKGFAI